MSGDNELLAAEQRLATIRREREQCVDDNESFEALSAELWKAYDQICVTPPLTWVGAAVKLRLLLDPDLGIEALDMSEGDFVSIRQIAELVYESAKGGEARVWKI